MNNKQLYTTQLGAGLGLIDETRVLLYLWQPGMKSSELYQTALNSGDFSNITARRLRNIVAECFTPRYLVKSDYPAIVLKNLIKSLSSIELTQLFFLFTSRANVILADFVKQIYWMKYAAGNDTISTDDAKNFVVDANRSGKTVRYWSDNMIKRVSSYLTGCLADFGMLEKGRKSVRKIIPFRVQPITIALLAYDLHFAGFGDNAVISHPDWELFGLQKEDIKEEIKRLSLKGFFIIQSAGDVISIGWNYKSWEELIHVISK
ncbi:MAG: DUF1819 family protein [Desulfamplus sp.]|nr:DUF1819 family protein [Desulfamplus sp.]